MPTREKRDPFFSDEDREVVVKYGSVPTEKLARQLGRTPAFIEKRALTLFKGAAVNGRWAEHETARLKGLFGLATTEQLSLILRRTLADVKAASTRLRNRAKTDEPLAGAELAEFKLAYGTRTDDDLAAIFGRTLDLIAASAETFCLSKDKAFVRKRGGDRTTMPRWDADSVAMLTELYSMSSNHEIAQRLGRSVKSVVSKAHALHLKKDHERLRQMGRDNVAKRYEK